MSYFSFQEPNSQQAALYLRIGLGVVFIIGGLNKLSQLLDPAKADAIVSSYWSTSGYVNQFFVDFMFGPNGLSEWWFLTSLSAFELTSGVLLVIGLFIRPLALFYAFLLWSFVIALPVVTTPTVEVSVTTYMAPALLVQVRDVALSGMMFVLFNLGAGLYSIDRRRNAKAFVSGANWDNLGLLLRLSLALPLLVAGVFHHMPNIPTFATHPLILVPLAILIIGGGKYLRLSCSLVIAVMLWYMVYKLNADKSLIGNLNGFKRECAFIGGAAVLAIFGGGKLYTFSALKGMLLPPPSQTLHER